MGTKAHLLPQASKSQQIEKSIEKQNSSRNLVGDGWKSCRTGKNKSSGSWKMRDGGGDKMMAKGAGNKGRMCLFHPRRGFWTRHAPSGKEYQDGRGARGKRKAEQNLVPRQEGKRILFTEQGDQRMLLTYSPLPYDGSGALAWVPPLPRSKSPRPMQ